MTKGPANLVTEMVGLSVVETRTDVESDMPLVEEHHLTDHGRSSARPHGAAPTAL